jgi:hypothetical protein
MIIRHSKLLKCGIEEVDVGGDGKPRLGRSGEFHDEGPACKKEEGEPTAFYSQIPNPQFSILMAVPSLEIMSNR